jgi:hypothetical protein
VHWQYCLFISAQYCLTDKPFFPVSTKSVPTWQDPLEYNYWKPILTSLSSTSLQYRNIEDLATAQAILDLR